MSMARLHTPLHALACTIQRAIAPPLPSRPWARLGALLATLAGWTLGLVWLTSVAPTYAALVAASLATALTALAGSRAVGLRKPIVLAARVLAWCGAAGLLYLAISLGTILGWSVPWSLRALVLLSLAAWLWSARVAWRWPRLPLCLPLGLWIAACLAGWMREDGLVRAEDYLRVRSDSRITPILLTSERLTTAADGDVLAVRRYPRHLWEAPDGSRLVFTTQPGIKRFASKAPVASDAPDGSVCEIPLDGSARPHCVGDGKAQEIIDAPGLDRLFVAAWGIPAGALPGQRRHGAVYVVPRSAPLSIVAELRHDLNFPELFYDAQADLLGAFADEGWDMIPIRASTLQAGAPIRTPWLVGDVRYDQQRHEGVACVASGPLRTIDGQAFAAVAFRGVPFSFRPLGASGTYPSTWLSLSEGCAWDPGARRVWVSIATLGLLGTLDYDSGVFLSRQFVGFGFRTVVHDARRQCVYLANFLGGHVIAVDLSSGAVLSRWFVGRFVRHIALARDGASLLAASNVGILRIALDKSEARHAAP